MHYKSLVLGVALCAGTLAPTFASAQTVETGTTEAAPQADYSRKMILSQNNDWISNKSVLWDLQWDYVPGLVCKSFLKAARQYPYESWAQESAYGKVKEYVDRAYSNNKLTESAINKWTLDDLSPSKMLFDMYDLAIEQDNSADAAKYKATLDYTYNYLTKKYTRIEAPLEGVGGFWHKGSYHNEMWLDGLYMGAAFYAEYLGHFANEMTESELIAAWDDIALQFDIIDSHTYDPATGLNYHAWSADYTSSSSTSKSWTNASLNGHSQEFWGRGMGWYFAALVDVLEHMPANHPKYAEVNATLQHVAQGLAANRDADSGLWCQLLQYPVGYKAKAGGNANYLESSASCMFTYAYYKGMRLGLLDEETYLPVAEKAYDGLLNNFITENSNGTINISNVCPSAGLGGSKNRKGDAEYYLDGSDTCPVKSNEGKAIGTFVMASLEHELKHAGQQGGTTDPDPVPSTKVDIVWVFDKMNIATNSSNNIEGKTYTDSYGNYITFSNNDLTLSPTPATIDEITYSKGILTNGKSDSGQKRYIKFNVVAPCTIEIGAVSNNAENRKFDLYSTSTDNKLVAFKSNLVSTSTPRAFTIEYTDKEPTEFTLSAQASVRYYYIKITYPDAPTSVETIEVQEHLPAPEYFDLTGRRISSPRPGNLYIVRRGTTVTKQIF